MKTFTNMEWRAAVNGAKARFYIFAFVLLVFIQMTICHEAKKPCSGVMTAGITYPYDDIVIEKGEALNINCSLYESYMRKNNISSDDLFFSVNGERLSKELIRKVNDSTIQLYIEDMRPAQVMYTCQTIVNGSTVPVCLNYVIVGTKPSDVLNFTCLSYNYENLTCTWIAPEHQVETKYNLTYHFLGRNNRAIFKCPNVTVQGNKYSCFWDLTTNPHYRQAQRTYYFNLNITNKFGEHKQKFTINHFEYVIPAPPENLTVVNKTSHSVTLSWSPKSPMQMFPSHVTHRLVYQSEYDDQWLTANTSIIDKVDYPVYTLSDLKYAHVLYDIRVSMRSSKADENDPRMWSKYASLTVRTESAVPGAAPELNIGSFEIETNRTSRNIFVYWKSIPEHLHNGENFSYNIIEMDKKIEPKEITYTYAKFESMSQNTHRFQVVSTNEVGRSVNSSVIVVPSLTDRVPEPILFTKIFYGNQVYELSWNPPKTDIAIDSYTIFYCRNDYDRPFPCKGYLQWVEVNGTTTMKNITVPEDRVYQFAISANSRNSSSGMVWASCTVIHDKEFTKMKKLWIDNIGSDFIEVTWKLDCSDRIGSIEGFIIYYCPIVSPVDPTCYSEEKTVSFSGDSTCGRIKNLKPYTTYMLTVSVKSKHNSNSLPSDPLYNTTLEAAPEPPENVTVSNITSTSMVISWSPPKAFNGVLRYYQVEYTCNGRTHQIKPVNERNTTVELKNLSSFTQYQIVVFAHTAFKSKPSHARNVTTAISVPGRMRSPNIKFQNESTILVAWNRPDVTGGRLDKYQLCVKEKINFENHTKYINTSDLQHEVDNCGTDKALKVLYFSVRAINYDDMKNEYVGEWSPETENYCQSSPRMLIWLFIGLGALIIVFIFVFLKKVWYRCQIMRDVEVKLPPGLAATNPSDLGMNNWPNTQKGSSGDNNLNTLSRADSSADEEHLLGKKAEIGDHERIPSGDSSGCSSGHESVTSSLASGTNLSSTSDSGTEQPRTPNSDSMSRENSLRQRKTGSEQNWEPELTWTPSDFISKPGKTLSPQGWSAPKVPTSNYCVLGVDNIIQQPDLSTNSGYVPVPLTITQTETSSTVPTTATTTITNPNKIATPPYVTCDTIFAKPEKASAVVAPQPLSQAQPQSQSPAYVKTSDAALLGRPAHLQHQQPAGGGKLVLEQQGDQPAGALSPKTPSYVMAGAPTKARFATKSNQDLITGKLINIEPLNEVDTYMQHSSEKDAAKKSLENSPRHLDQSPGYVKTEDILGLKGVENRGSRSRRGSDETATQSQNNLQLQQQTQHQQQQQQQQQQQPQQPPTTLNNPYCRLGWDKSAGVADSSSLPTTPTLKKGDATAITKGYVPHRQFENKSLKED